MRKFIVVAVFAGALSSAFAFTSVPMASAGSAVSSKELTSNPAPIMPNLGSLSGVPSPGASAGSLSGNLASGNFGGGFQATAVPADPVPEPFTLALVAGAAAAAIRRVKKAR
ncbi:MAG: hypothetical protein SNJ74_12765 [Fimbriimonadaceae bacterium]